LSRSCIPSSRARARPCSPRAWARRRARGGTGLSHRRRCRRAAERGERVILVRSETSPEDVHGHARAEGILTARGGLVSARGGRGPGLGQARRGGSGEGPHQPAGRSASGPPSSTRGTGSPSTGRRRGRARSRSSWPKPRRRRSSRHCSAGPTSSARDISRCVPTPTTVLRRQRAAHGAEGIGLCRIRAPVSSPRTACPSCAG